jgi:hypothetical protein
LKSLRLYPARKLGASLSAAIEKAKKINIISISLGFAAMLRIFSSESKRKYETRLGKLFSSLSEIRFRDDYELRHHSFCLGRQTPANPIATKVLQCLPHFSSVRVRARRRCRPAISVMKTI